MKKRTLFFALALVCGLGLAASAKALSVTPGDLIKGPGDTVYYYGADGMRHVFPNLKTYMTWYPDFSNVKSIPLSELQAISLNGKNVTYKPGVRLVKITTDPKVYAVGAHATLRWVQTEELAVSLYGADWNKKIDDVADAFFINYQVGSPITSTADFNPSAVSAAATDIGTDMQTPTVPTTPTTPTTPTPTSTTPTTPTPTSTSNVTFTTSEITYQGGDVVTLNAQAQDPSGIYKIELYFDGQLQKTCFSASCSGDTLIPQSGTKQSYVAEARVTTVNQQLLNKTVTMTQATDGSKKITVRVGQIQITPSMYASAVADVDASVGVQRIDIYVDGNIVKGCATGARQCQWTDILTNNQIGSVHPVKATVTDTIGRVYTSDTTNITVASTDAPAVTVTPAKDMIYTGETVDITVSASDNDGITSIDVMQNGVVLKHCVGASPCTATTGPWNTIGSQIFAGRAYDTQNTLGTGTSTAVSVTARP
ncbi:MAG: Ig-like domain-containing protein [Patescibacteria group bacterium]